jgi:hypothetical protein
LSEELKDAGGQTVGEGDGGFWSEHNCFS